jgi:hypothetical protein
VQVSYLSLQKAADTLKREVKAREMEMDRNKLCQAKQDKRCIYFNGFLTVHRSVDLNLSPT